MNTQEAEARIIARATKDPKFREALKKDPVAAIESELGVKSPGGITVKVLEDTPDTIHLVLPPKVPERELSARDLEKVAGGAVASQFQTVYSRCQGPGVTLDLNTSAGN